MSELKDKQPEPRSRYVLSPPSGSNDWWQINDMEKMYAVVSIQSSVPCAEEIIRLAWDRLVNRAV